MSDFYKKHFVDLRVLDTTCDPAEVPAPKVHHGHVQEYLTSENILLPGQKYHEVVYKCDEGFKLTEGMLGHMFCQQKGWMGVEPYCEEDPNYDKAVNAVDTQEPENLGSTYIVRIFGVTFSTILCIGNFRPRRMR